MRPPTTNMIPIYNGQRNDLAAGEGVQQKTATNESDTSTELPKLPIPNAEQPISWREVLLQTRVMATYDKVTQEVAEIRSAACMGCLARNGYGLHEFVDPKLIDRVSKMAIGWETAQFPELVSQDSSADAKAAVADLLRALSACIQSRSHHQPIAGPLSSLSLDGTPLSAVSTLTYDQLTGVHEKGRAKVGKKTVQNELSALRRFMSLLGHVGEDDCRWIAEQEEFERRLASCKVDDRSFRSTLNQVRTTVCILIESANPANTLWESYVRAFHRHVNRGGNAVLMSKNAFILHCFGATGMSRRRLNARKIQVQGKTFERVQELENSLGAEGHLTRWLINMSDNNAVTFQTDYGKRVAEAVNFRYALLWEDWPPELKREWNELFLLRTNPLQASRKWDLHLENVPKKKLYTWRIKTNDGSCPSADKQRRELECFFGWCLQERAVLPNGDKNLWRSGPESSLTKSDLSLALVTDQDLFDGYIAFRKAHTLTEAQVISGKLGEFNRSCKTFVELTSSLLNPLTGFIYLRKDLYFRLNDVTPSARNLAPRVGTTFFNRELGKSVTITDPDERWLYFCKKIRYYMELTHQNEFDESLMTRDREPIEAILALNDPMEAIVELLQKLDDSEPTIEYWKAFHRRKQLFFKLISVCPLRILQYAFMTGKHLSKEGRSFYRIRFNKDEFKNERFIAEQDYEFNLPDDFTAFIDNYLAHVWPALNGRPFTPEDRVFAARLENYDLNLMSVTDIAAIPETGKRLVIVAGSRTDCSLHFRIFDRNGVRVLDACENDFPGKIPAITALKKQISPLCARALTSRTVSVILELVTAITAHTHCDNGERMAEKDLSQAIKTQLCKICRETTARHLGKKYKTPGFYPHAIRHIKATSIIKMTGSYEEAALLLWDAVETVRKAYAHVKRIEQLAKASSDDYTRMKNIMERPTSQQK